MKKRLIGMIMVFLGIIAIGGCGGSGSDSSEPGGQVNSPEALIGYFLDRNANGVKYQTESQTGITDEDGAFSYLEGETVTFSVGNVELGKAKGKEVITPVDFVPGADADDPTVNNIVRFLMMLDNDAAPDNGITVSEAIQSSARGWTSVNFESNDLDSEVSTILSDVSTADNRNAQLPVMTDASNHLKNTIYRAFSGGFKGTYTGNSSGTWMIVVDALTGKITGTGHSNSYRFDFELSGDLSTKSDLSFGLGIAASSAGFNGSITSSGVVSGAWEDLPNVESGTLSGEKIRLETPSGSSGKLYSGTFTGTDIGIFVFAINDGGQINGEGYANGDIYFDIEGARSNDSISFTGENGVAFTATGSFTSLQDFEGTWTGAGSSSGDFSGSKLLIK